jgi:pyridoxine kinase
VGRLTADLSPGVASGLHIPARGVFVSVDGKNAPMPQPFDPWSSAPAPAAPLPLVIAIQSQVAYGHVGNSAAAWPMRALGVEVVEVPTTLLSNHPRYPTMRGQVLDPALVADLLRGLDERGLPECAAAILTGFMGRAETAAAVADFVARARARNPAIVYACDPVMGDADIGFFAAEDLRAVFAERLVPQADVIFPNAFELAALGGRAIERPADVAEARALVGVPAVVATSVPVPGRPDLIATVTAGATGLAQAVHPRLPVRPAGTGDLLAGLSVARLARGVPLPDAVAAAAAGVQAALRNTPPGPWAEMPITRLLPEILAAGGYG